MIVVKKRKINFNRILTGSGGDCLRVDRVVFSTDGASADEVDGLMLFNPCGVGKHGGAIRSTIMEPLRGSWVILVTIPSS